MSRQPSVCRAAPTATRLAGRVGALVLSLALTSCADREDGPVKAAAGTAPEPTPQQLYLSYCGSCHGAEGRGDGPLAAELRVAPINLRALKEQNDGRYPMQRVQRSIDGRGMPRAHGLPDMPVWGRVWIVEGLSEAKVQARSIAIASYIASIQD